MADGFVKVAPDSTGKIIDTSEITVGTNTVERQRINIADPSVAANIVTVSATGALKVDGTAATTYTTALDYDSANNLIYSGTAVAGSLKTNAVWQIKKLTYSGTVVTDVQYAGGSTAYSNVWNNRVGLTYS